MFLDIGTFEGTCPDDDKRFNEWLDACADELAPIFASQGWTWSGEDVPDRWRIRYHLISLTYDCAARLRKGEKRWSWSAGRIKVEMHFVDTDSQTTVNLNAYMDFIVGPSL